MLQVIRSLFTVVFITFMNMQGVWVFLAFVCKRSVFRMVRRAVSRANVKVHTGRLPVEVSDHFN